MYAIRSYYAIITYTFYTIDDDTVAKFGTNNLIYTLPIVTYGMFRYLYIMYKRHEGGDPTEIIASDKGILLSLFAWIIAVLFIIKIGVMRLVY